ncbi:Membrane-associated protein [Calidithermus terrae]|uniref:Membrane-associated protein n=1 Tax=Calidithermus terrae TaxID=1408545 RepID=A0A399EAC0_9DEIN|nr:MULTISPECIES: nitrogen regulatory protein P-II [Calidithermus]RIH81697.1 Membrane-associated protein [Calidithermus terrae]
MQTVPLKLVTIIAEAFLEEKLVREVKKLGASGYTLSPARGEGSRGVRASEWEGGNVRLEVVASPQVAERILERLAEVYFPSYAVIAFTQTVEVVRGEKYA